MNQRLEQIAESVDYGVTASAANSPIGPKFLRITDIQDGQVDWRSVPWCKCDKRESESSRLKAGDIVFARTGATTGKSYLINECPDDAVFASYLIRVRLKKIADPKFVGHFFQSVDYWKQITKGSRGAAQPGVNASTLKQLQIPLPPLAEQKRIAAILDAADALRTKRREALAQLDALLQSSFLTLFADPVENPMGWPQSELGDLVADDDRINYGVVQPGDECPGGRPLIRVGDFVGGELDLSGIKFIDPKIDAQYERSRLLGTELLVSCVGSIGTICRVPLAAKGHNIARAVARVPLGSKVEREFMLFCLRSSGVQNYFSNETRTVSQPTLNIGLIKAATVTVPPLPLQQKFAAIVESVERQKAAQRAHLAELDALFAALQHRTFRGEL
jgi:type I restriction enzyme S subunit